LTIFEFFNSNIRRQAGVLYVRTLSGVLGSDGVSSGFIVGKCGTLLTLIGLSSNVYSVAWSPDGSKIVTVSYDRTARVWSSSSGSTLLTLTGYVISVLAVACLAWSPDDAGDDCLDVQMSCSI
jgi:WD40 repeat protein